MISYKIKTIYNKGLLILGILATTFSCSKTLDLNPEANWAAEDFYASESDIEAALAGIYSNIAARGAFGRHLILFDLGTDEAIRNRDFGSDNPVGHNDHNPTDVDIQLLWQTLYKGINNANNFIKYIDASKFEDEADFNKYVGEVKFLRGFMYYHLTVWFNEVPLRLEPVLDQSSNHVAPSPLGDVYTQIIADLTFAAEHLPSAFDSDYKAAHANKGAAHAMLAKTYLKAAGYPLRATEINGKNPYQAVKEHCQAVMDLGHNLNMASYKDVFLNYIQNRYDYSESLLEVAYSNGTALGIPSGGPIGYINGLTWAGNLSKIGLPVEQRFNRPTPLHDFIYEEGDTRKSWNVPNYNVLRNAKYPNGTIKIVPNVLAGPSASGKFRRWDAVYPDDIPLSNEQLQPWITLETPQPVHQSVTGLNFPLIRFSDVLLMYAEAENELNGPTSVAQDAINMVRNRAGLDNLATAKPEAIAGKEAFFNELVDERLRELCFEGLRKTDLIRWGLYEEKLNVLYQSIINYPPYRSGNVTHNRKFSAYTNFDPSKHLSLPYPEQEVDLNNLLNQKPEWQ
ncbi:RagB/SusD family nutrient uptake outer membrane protein [Gaetbulibacter saemankumensis]|uniref:RagB/SusD family nutrient uptake outer membrane protein n=1 Tax=Gaetbulibacter saemankumensis TaxID=311208 RepID=UPI000423F9D4|nr:RagB/SusD family nutrient uptake outer membrane protein [Gaetbulibacter saemankumensis]